MKRTSDEQRGTEARRGDGAGKRRGLKLTDAVVMLATSYRQAKRLWRQYRKQGPDGLKHGNAGRRSNRSKSQKFRRRVLQLVRKKYSGAVGFRFGPTLAAQHLLQEDSETWRRWMLSEGLWSQERKRMQYRQRRDRRGILASWCKWMKVFTLG